MDGTADAAQVTMQLRAVGVHRAEFVPASPLDFDANCAFIYHYTFRSVQNLDCNPLLGDGHLKVTGEKLGLDAPPHYWNWTAFPWLRASMLCVLCAADSIRIWRLAAR